MYVCMCCIQYIEIGINKNNPSNTLSWNITWLIYVHPICMYVWKYVFMYMYWSLSLCTDVECIPQELLEPFRLKVQQELIWLVDNLRHSYRASEYPLIVQSFSLSSDVASATKPALRSAKSETNENEINKTNPQSLLIVEVETGKNCNNTAHISECFRIEISKTLK